MIRRRRRAHRLVGEPRAGIRLLVPLLPFVLLAVPSSILRAEVPADSPAVDTRKTLRALEQEEDTDHDRKITVNDPCIPGTHRGDRRFQVTTLEGRKLEVAGTHYLSNLLQELTRESEAGRDTARLNPGRIFEPPLDRISRLIATHYWDALTRRIDEAGMLAILDDEKTASADGRRYLYVPGSDESAYAYYAALGARNPDWNLVVLRLAGVQSPETRRSLSTHPGLLSLALRRDSAGVITPLPFVVPGGRFNEMYGWDSYFIVRGLLCDRRVELARAMVDHQVYEITHYGAVLNANRTYYLSRSQPPFLTSAALDVFAALPADSRRREWLAGVLLAAIAEYRGVWMGPDRLTATGLSRYYDSEGGVPPEVEPGHYETIFAPFAKNHGMTVAEFERAYRSGRVREAALDTFFIHDRSMRESGHDTSYRLLGRSADLATVDLNSLLYKIESDIAGALRDIFGGRLVLPGGEVEEAESWHRRAERRKELINRFCWDSTQGLFFDYDTRKGERVAYVSTTTFYPLWAGLASADQAVSVARNALPLLEMPGGLVSTSEESRGALSDERPPRQWDYPYGWAPHQMIAWGGLGRYGFEASARRLAYRWLYTIVRNAADYNGTVPEKFDVVGRTHEVFAEYGNVGTDFSYITREGFGWTNASVQCGRALMSETLRAKLNALIPPEWITDW